MTEEEFERFHEVMMEKYLPQLHWWPTKEEAVRSIIGGVIADTTLLADGTVPLESWENAIQNA